VGKKSNKYLPSIDVNWNKESIKHFAGKLRAPEAVERRAHCRLLAYGLEEQHLMALNISPFSSPKDGANGGADGNADRAGSRGGWENNSFEHSRLK
jgi:hypothetical protein